MLETELNYPEHLTKKVAFIQDTHLKKKKILIQLIYLFVSLIRKRKGDRH